MAVALTTNSAPSSAARRSVVRSIVDARLGLGVQSPGQAAVRASAFVVGVDQR